MVLDQNLLLENTFGVRGYDHEQNGDQRTAKIDSCERQIIVEIYAYLTEYYISLEVTQQMQVTIYV